MSADVETAPTTLDANAAELAGLDALETVREPRQWGRRIWRSSWPKVLALALTVAVWQATVASGWRSQDILPAPATVFQSLRDMLTTGVFWNSVVATMQRGISGFAVAVAVGLLIGFAVARFAVLRAAIGSLITGLQTMPSIAWFPLAIVLFVGSSQSAIFFVVVLGAAPSVANGVLAGVDYVPPLLVRAGRNMGASGFGLYRTVIGPASLPAIVAGLKQGWAFSWRSLMAGELLMQLDSRGGLGVSLIADRELQDYPSMMAVMIVILVLGILADAVFGLANTAIRRRWGLMADHHA